MQKWLAKHKLLLILTSFFLLFRLINLTIIPIFNDESIYLDWGWRELHLNVLFYSLSDGKQPFLMWLFGMSEEIFTDPLMAGRVVSVIAGLFTFFGLYRIGKELYNEKVGYIAGMLYIIIPLFSFFDRQALMESSVAASEVWSIYLLLKLLKKHSIKNAVFLGIVLGVGFFVKSTILLLVLTFIIVYLFIVKFHQENKKFWLDGLISIVISQIVLLPLYLQPLFWQNLSMNDRYSMGINELIRFPVGIWLSNIWAFLQISFWQLTPLVFIAMIVGIYMIFKSGGKDQKVLTLIFLFQIIFFILVAKNVSPRYTMPMLPLSVFFVAVLVTKYKTWSKWLIASLIVIPLYFLFLQLFIPNQYFDQLQAITPYSQKSDYMTDDTAGYAVTQAIDYIQSANLNAAFVAVRLDAGNPENAIFTYFHNSKIRKATYLESRIIANVQDYQCLSFTYPLYFVSRDSQLAGLNPYLEEEKRFYNPEGRTSVGIYHFKSSCTGKTLNLATPGAILQPSQTH